MNSTRPRIILFGGQGSSAVFSPQTAVTAQKDAETCISGLVLASKCHVAFLEELSYLGEERRRLLGVDIGRFHRIKDILVPPPDYHHHGLVQSTTLCLYQLLHYLAEIERSGASFSSSLSPVLEVTGFCAGLLPAVVVAASDTVQEFVRFAVEAFRLSFWIGCRATLASRKIVSDQPPEPSWSLIVLGLDYEQVARRLRDFDESHTRRMLRISAVSAHKTISVSGPGNELLIFREHLGHSVTTKFAHVHAWYHGGVFLEDAVQEVVQDVNKRGVQLPSYGDLSRPVRSTLDGAILVCTDSKPLDVVQWVVRHILVHCVNWVMVSSAISEVIRGVAEGQSKSPVQLVSFGPSSGLLLADIKTQSGQSNVEVLDLSPFMPAKASIPHANCQDGIAIVGMGIDLPKGKGPQKLWETLSSGLSSIQEIPESRFKLDEFHSDIEDQKPRTMRVRHGAFLDDIWTFDNTFFNISPREAKSMDPQQRILLHTVQAALDDAGYVKDSTPSFQSSSTGCYIGLATGDYADNLCDSIDVFYSQGTLRAFHSGRVSYVYKLSGPSIVTDTACSSSLVSIYQACRALQNGDCTAALAGGVNAICSPNMFLGLAKGHFLSPTGGCKPFDASADGYGRAEGCVVFVLKRLSDALAENDRIHGVIKDVMVNQSGNAHSITHPHSDTQVDLMRRIFQKNDVDPASISVVEAHGTGTQAGDTREIASLQAFFGKSHSLSSPLMVSSIKGNVGHCEAASGAAGLAKLLLMLRKREIPMQASLRLMNPRITGLEEAGIIIPTKTNPWQSGHNSPRRAMLNNFGAAGSNSVLLLEELISSTRGPPTCNDRSGYIFNISARTRDALSDLVARYQDFLPTEAADGSLKDVCYTATARRQVYDYRLSIPCTSLQDLQSNLRKTNILEIDNAKVRSKTIFVFSGQGSSYTGMGAELLRTSPLFKKIVMSCDQILQTLGFSGILPMINEVPTDMPERADGIIMSQCACVTLEYALAKLLMSWNLIPDVVIGHSLGEYAALAVSETLSIEDTLRIVAYRAKLMATMCTSGTSGMLACKLSPLQAEDIIGSANQYSQLNVACKNSHNDSVVAGPLEQLDQFQEVCHSQNIKVKKLDVPYGFHSAAMDPILTQLTAFGGSVEWCSPKVQVVSNVFGRYLSREDCTQRYFALHARQPVCFQDSIKFLAAEELLDDALCLEIGPHPITIPMIRSAVEAASCTCVPTLQRGRPAWISLSTALSQISMFKNNIDWRAVFDSSHARMTDAPGYPLKGTSFAVPYQEHHRNNDVEQPGSLNPSSDTGFALLPKLINHPSPDASLLFETTTIVLGPLIAGHNVGGTAICPASVFCELAIEGSQGALGTSEDEFLCVEDLKFMTPLIYDPSEGSRSVQVHVTETKIERTADVKITGQTQEDNQEIIYCTGRVSVQAAQESKRQFLRDSALVKRQSVSLQDVNNRSLNRFQKKLIYEAIFPRVVRYSEHYQTLIELNVSESGLEGIGTFALSSSYDSESCVTSPVFTDTLLHSAGFIANLSVSSDTVCICSHVASVEILYRNMKYTESFTVYCSLLDIIEGVIMADAFALNTAGELVGRICGMEFKKLRLSSLQRVLSVAGPSKVESERPRCDTPLEPSPVDSFNAPNASKSGTTTPIQENLTQTVQNTLTRIIQDVGGFQNEDIDITGSLESLGIDSIMQIEITLKLKNAFPGHDLDHNRLAHCESVLALKSLIMSMLGLTAEDDDSHSSKSLASTDRTSREASSQSSLSEIEKINPTILHLSTSSNIPMCLFHDGSGLVSMYAHMGDFDRSTYAFSNPSVFNPKVHFASLEQMTGHYVSRLISLGLPSLILGGWSFGGVLAWEAARQLLQIGFSVKGLVLIDSPNPLHHEPLPDSVIQHVCRPALPGGEDRVPTSNATLARQFQQNAALLGKYKPATPAFSGIKTVMLRSQQTFDTETECGVRYDWLMSQEARDNAVKGWEELLGGRIEVFPIPGNHFEAFIPENIVQTSAQLRRACRYIENAQ